MKKEKGALNHKGIYIAMLLTFMIFSYGCGENRPSTMNYRSGTRGVEINFAQSSPPDQIYVGSGENKMPVNIEVRNVGAESCSNAKIFLSGYDPSIIPLPTVRDVPKLEGKEESKNPSGSLEYLTIGEPTINLPNGVDAMDIRLMATLCYDYMTRASTNVCIDPNPSKPGSRACTPQKSYSMSGGQGGPVSVTSIEQDSGVGNVVFKFTIKNTGGGEVIEKGNVAGCMGIDFSKKDVVYVTGGTLSNKNMECTPSKVRLVNGEGLVVCKVSGLNTQDNAYTTTVQLNLDYGYKYSTIKSVQIRRM